MTEFYICEVPIFQKLAHSSVRDNENFEKVFVLFQTLRGQNEVAFSLGFIRRNIMCIS